MVGVLVGARDTAERWARRLGYVRIAGTDEAGRGALAGPLVAAAVILPAKGEIQGLEELTDSKLLTPAARKSLFGLILDNAEAWSFSCISPWDIDEEGLQPANMTAMREAVLSLEPAPDLVVVDYYHVEGLCIPQWSIVHGDRVCRSVAAASILAKVIRDHLMTYWSLHSPQYGFESNKGYGTAQHLKALADHGPLPCHRSSFHGVLQMEMVLECADEE
ncbi:MAG: ribonuclease HII [Actinobacteria bacterium]|nr:MAG: ribonuclease HII [Actinomycetota bacterium]